MPSNYQKTPLDWSLNTWGRGKAREFSQQLGKSYPCHVVAIVKSGVVTIQFDVNSTYNMPEIATVPVAEPEYVRYPIQVGDRGVAFSADAYLGGVTGLGTGTAGLAQPGNLSVLVFQPLANASWQTVDNNALTLYGPNGVVIEDSNKKTVITLTPTGVTIALQAGDAVEIVGDLKVTGEVTAKYNTSSPIPLSTHVHDDPQGGVTGPPQAP
jgi:hypothetical protein